MGGYIPRNLYCSPTDCEEQVFCLNEKDRWLPNAGKCYGFFFWEETVNNICQINVKFLTIILIGQHNLTLLRLHIQYRKVELWIKTPGRLQNSLYSSGFEWSSLVYHASSAFCTTNMNFYIGESVDRLVFRDIWSMIEFFGALTSYNDMFHEAILTITVSELNLSLPIIKMSKSQWMQCCEKRAVVPWISN